MYPNSHRVVYEQYYTTKPVPPKKIDEERKLKKTASKMHDKIIICLQKGDIFIFNALLLHYGPAYPPNFLRLHTYFYHKLTKIAFLKNNNTQTYPFDFKFPEGKFFSRSTFTQGSTIIENNVMRI